MTPQHRAESFELEAVPHLEAVYRFALRLTRSPADADDLVQETYLRGFRSWHRFTPGTRAKSWLFTICRNAFLRQRARERRRSELARAAVLSDVRSDEPQPVTLASGTSARAPDALIDDVILRRIQDLPAEFRAAVIACDVCGTAYADAAAALGVPLGTLKSRLHRGRRLLQGTLAGAAAEHGIRRTA